jgi:hypothetical protein
LFLGRPPVLAETVQETLTQVRSQVPAQLSEIQPQVPRELDTICLKCLQKAPTRRYATALALADELARFLSAAPSPGVWQQVLHWLKRPRR